MSVVEVHQLAQVPLTAHAFSPDRNRVAVSLNSNEVTVYTRSAVGAGAGWNVEETLAEHDKLITSIDWAPNTNRIVTSSQDRNAYVWTQVQDPQTGKTIWKPTLVLLRINRAATAVKWSPKEDKFAVASGARAIAICSFDADNDWWVSKLLKKPIRSTILSIDWHENNVLLAAGGADSKARVFSAYIKDVDKRPSPTVWGEKLPFNTLCGEFSSAAGGWVHSVGFSPSGNLLGFVSHDSTVTIVYPGPTPTLINIKINSLPHVTLTWVSEESIVAAGHDCQPILFSCSGGDGQWKQVGSLDDASSSSRSSSTILSPGGARGGGASGIGRLNNEAFNRFRNADTRGGAGGGSPSALQTQFTGASTGGALGAGTTEMLTIHQNTITELRPYEIAGSEVTKVSSSGVDGRLVVWNVDYNAASTNGASAGLAGRMAGMSVSR